MLHIRESFIVSNALNCWNKSLPTFSKTDLTQLAVSNKGIVGSDLNTMCVCVCVWCVQIVSFWLSESVHFCRCRQTRTSSLGPCHHNMARPQVADGGTASNMEGSCEYIE